MRFSGINFVDNNFSEPVTVASLIAHTAGFDEISSGRRTRLLNKLIPLKTFLKDRLVRRQAPNKKISYSTYGITLAGHLVEERTGLSLQNYFEKDIFKPLKMNRTNLGGIKDAILDYYFPVSKTPDNPELHKELHRYAGQYRWDLYCHTCDADKRGFYPRPFRIGVNK